jgi:hypothetical protein
MPAREYRSLRLRERECLIWVETNELDLHERFVDAPIGRPLLSFSVR